MNTSGGDSHNNSNDGKNEDAAKARRTAIIALLGFAGSSYPPGSGHRTNPNCHGTPTNPSAPQDNPQPPKSVLESLQEVTAQERRAYQSSMYYLAKLHADAVASGTSAPAIKTLPHADEVRATKLHLTNEAMTANLRSLYAEVSMLRGITDAAARRLVRDAVLMCQLMPQTMALFVAAEVPAYGPSVISHGVVGLAPSKFEYVDAELAGILSAMLTCRHVLSRDELERAIALAVSRHDPDAFDIITEEAGKLRRRVTVCGDFDKFRGSRLTAVLDKAEATLVFAFLTKLAKTVCKKDPRTLAHRRADALLTICQGYATLGCECGNPECEWATKQLDTGKAADRLRVQIIAIVNDDTTTDPDDTPTRPWNPDSPDTPDSPDSPDSPDGPEPGDDTDADADSGDLDDDAELDSDPQADEPDSCETDTPETGESSSSEAPTADSAHPDSANPEASPGAAQTTRCPEPPTPEAPEPVEALEDLAAATPTDNPETGSPETNSPETNSPETSESETQESDINEPLQAESTAAAQCATDAATEPPDEPPPDEPPPDEPPPDQPPPDQPPPDQPPPDEPPPDPPSPAEPELGAPYYSSRPFRFTDLDENRMAVLLGFDVITTDEIRRLTNRYPTRISHIGKPRPDGTILGQSGTGYTPTADLRRAIWARDLQCTFPGCTKPVRGCDLDHTNEYNHANPAHGGPTTFDNLKAVCRTHHIVLTHTEWISCQNTDGSNTYQSPLGQKATTNIINGFDLFPGLPKIRWTHFQPPPPNPDGTGEETPKLAEKHRNRKNQRANLTGPDSTPAP